MREVPKGRRGETRWDEGRGGPAASSYRGAGFLTHERLFCGGAAQRATPFSRDGEGAPGAGSGRLLYWHRCAGLLQRPQVRKGKGSKRGCNKNTYDPIQTHASDGNEACALSCDHTNAHPHIFTDVRRQLNLSTCKQVSVHTRTNIHIHYVHAHPNLLPHLSVHIITHTYSHIQS